MAAAKTGLIPKEPYPGLRSFEANESLLFHGRDLHTEQLLRRLSQNRFLAVVGGSGSGKSSLVRAGLLPALYRGYLVGATSRWRVAVMRPGSSPLSEMTKALAAPEALGAADQESIRQSSFGLVNAVKSAGLSSGESLLLVVDQFEELFRFRRESVRQDGGAVASLFVSQLLQAADEYGASVYVVLTMRSDFLGDCAQFANLPEALNKGQYLIPRMTREQRRDAITASLDYFDVAMSDRLVQRLLNDAGDDPDQLPILQHALRQTYRRWEERGRKGEIDIQDYEAAGTMERALHNHAQRLYESIDEEVRWLAERLFRCVTVLENGRAVRRPAQLSKVLDVIGVAGDPLYEPAAIEVIKRFTERENSLLLVGGGQNFDQDSVVDITHESLIRKWGTLGDWVKAEARVADFYRYLRRDAGLYPDQAGLWGEPDLGSALRCKREVSWNEAWAEQYSDTPGVGFEKVEGFLAASVAAERKRQKRERLYWWLRVGSVALALLVVVGGIRLWLVQRENLRLQAARAESERQTQRLSGEAARLRADAAERQQKIDELASRGDPAARAELQRLRKEQESTRQSLADRERLIKDNKDQVSKVSGDYAEALKRINELQQQLTQAWKERDQARNELQRPSEKLSPEQRKMIDTPVQQQQPYRNEPEMVQSVPAQPPAPGPRDKRVNPKDRLTYVRIPAGTFMMGCSSGDKDCQPDEAPSHRVAITKDFYIGETEVTQEAFRRVRRQAPSSVKGDQLPVFGVRWYDAFDYCRDAGMRLPTEAEWEYAARAASRGPRYGPIASIAWYVSNSNRRPHPVKQKAPNDWGLYDMLGNVWEWTEDWYNESFYRRSKEADPVASVSGDGRVIRGLSWEFEPQFLRVSVREKADPSKPPPYVGFRCAGELAAGK